MALYGLGKLNGRKGAVQVDRVIKEYCGRSVAFIPSTDDEDLLGLLVKDAAAVFDWAD